MTEQPFIFVGTTDLTVLDADFVIRIPKEILSKEILFSVFALEGRFPSESGTSWDALLDCLRDLSWIRAKRIAIVHESLPLKDSGRDCDIYLRILKTAVRDWMERRDTKVIPGVRLNYVEHELMVYFPSTVKDAIDQRSKENGTIKVAKLE